MPKLRCDRGTHGDRPQKLSFRTAFNHICSTLFHLSEHLSDGEETCFPSYVNVTPPACSFLFLLPQPNRSLKKTPLALLTTNVKCPVPPTSALRPDAPHGVRAVLLPSALLTGSHPCPGAASFLLSCCLGSQAHLPLGLKATLPLWWPALPTPDAAGPPPTSTPVPQPDLPHRPQNDSSPWRSGPPARLPVEPPANGPASPRRMRGLDLTAPNDDPVPTTFWRTKWKLMV